MTDKSGIAAEVVFSEAQMEAIFASLPVALITTDDKREIVGANEAALKLFGYTLEELLGEPVETLMPESAARSHPKMYEGFVKRPATRPMGIGRELAGRKKDGTEFPVEVGLTLMPQNPPRYLAAVNDISLRKKTERLMRERQQFLEAKLDELTGTLEKQVEERTRLEERQRLGRELHDSLSQNLYGIGLGLRTAKAKIKKEQDPISALDYCLTLTEGSLVEMRALLFRLRPKTLENVPLADVLASHTQAVAARTKLNLEFQQIGTTRVEPPFEYKYALYRIVTEALHNCVKHANADEVVVRLRYSKTSITAEVIDNGCGFSPDEATGGHGLEAMRERAEAVGGVIDLRTGEEGTSVSANVPWQNTN